jgi:flagellar basal-body rod protein FlgG
VLARAARRGTTLAELPAVVNGIETLVPRMAALWRRHEVLANNLANASTPGFKLDDVAVMPGPPPAAAVASAGSGTLVQWTSFAPGAIVPTGRSLDVAINGPGFLTVGTAAGARYTRAGNLTVDAEGFLVTAGGARVLGERGPVVVGPGPVTIGPRGEVMGGGRRIDTLRVVDFPRAERLTKQGHGLFAAASEPTAPTAYEIIGGALEASNVNVVEAVVGMIDVLRQYETAQRALQSEDEVVRRATAEMGRA